MEREGERTATDWKICMFRMFGHVEIFFGVSLHSPVLGMKMKFAFDSDVDTYPKLGSIACGSLSVVKYVYT